MDFCRNHNINCNVKILLSILSNVSGYLIVWSKIIDPQVNDTV